MNFSRARQKVAVIADRLFAIVCHGSMRPKQWDSMSFISPRFIRSAIRTAKGAIIRSFVSQATRAFRGRSEAKRADTKRWSLHLERWAISIGFKNKCENVEWRLGSTWRSIAHPIILT